MNIQTPDGTPMTPAQKIVEDHQAPLLAEVAAAAADYRKDKNGSQKTAQRLHRAVVAARQSGITEPVILSAIAK